MHPIRFLGALVLFLFICLTAPANAQEDATIVQTGEAEMFREVILGVAASQRANAAAAARAAGVPALADVVQTGTGHEAIVAQQGGQGLYAAITQSGSAPGSNSARIEQRGIDLTSVLIQAGSLNVAAITQSGVGHAAIVTQIGVGNRASITQNN
jgi:hypothetical protein